MNKFQDSKPVILNPTIQWIFTFAITIILSLIGWSVSSIERRSAERTAELERRLTVIENAGSAPLRERLAAIDVDIKSIRGLLETNNRVLISLLRETRNDTTKGKQEY